MYFSLTDIGANTILGVFYENRVNIYMEFYGPWWRMLPNAAAPRRPSFGLSLGLLGSETAA